MDINLSLISESGALFKTRLGSDRSVLRSALRVGFESAAVEFAPGMGEEFSSLHAEFGKSMIFGAYGIYSTDLACEAVEAGAKFIVASMPELSIFKTCAGIGIPVIAEAATMTEVRAGVALGAAAVAIFPARPLGVEYFRLLCEESKIMLAASGGIDELCAGEFIEAGAGFVIVEDHLPETRLGAVIKAVRTAGAKGGSRRTGL